MRSSDFVMRAMRRWQPLCDVRTARRAGVRRFGSIRTSRGQWRRMPVPACAGRFLVRPARDWGEAAGAPLTPEYQSDLRSQPEIRRPRATADEWLGISCLGFGMPIMMYGGEPIEIIDHARHHLHPASTGSSMAGASTPTGATGRRTIEPTYAGLFHRQVGRHRRRRQVRRARGRDPQLQGAAPLRCVAAAAAPRQQVRVQGALLSQQEQSQHPA